MSDAQTEAGRTLLDELGDDFISDVRNIEAEAHAAGLEAAWQRTVAALPEGWVFSVLYRPGGPQAQAWNPDDPMGAVFADGDTPAAALDNLRAALASERQRIALLARPEPEAVSDLRELFRERGWSIHMDDRPGQAVDPWEIIAALDAQPVGLDVERLAKALDRYWTKRYGPAGNDNSMEPAKEIAAEYESLRDG